MFRRYHIQAAPMPLGRKVGKFRILREEEGCLNCGRCAEECIYGVHSRDSVDPRRMAEPDSSLCKNCFACIEQCPHQALAMIRNPEYEAMGSSYWTPDVLTTIWTEADEGKLPVLGAGYRGPFRGKGFDEIWTDMSEIVRPTRDGIHGREYIATAVDIGRKPGWISDFLRLEKPRYHEIQVPLLLDAHPLGLQERNVILAAARAAYELDTFLLLDSEAYFKELESYSSSIALAFSLEKILNGGKETHSSYQNIKLIEVVLPQHFSKKEVGTALQRLKGLNGEALVSLGVRDPEVSPDLMAFLQEKQADILNLHADFEGMSPDGKTFISDTVRAAHLEFVRRGIRDEITILGKGGIAAAEHVPKLIICGADAVVLDVSLLVALGCRVCSHCQVDQCPVEIKTVDPDFGTQRILNLVCAWRDQLLEVLGAMGIRDMRRLRGEVGRAMFYEEIERESFSFIFEDGA